MKIALVHELLVRLGGAERVLYKLSQMFPEAPIYTLVHNRSKTDEWFDNRKIIRSALQPIYEITGSHRTLLPAMSWAIERFDFSDYDLVISSSSAFAHGIKTSGKTRHLCYCHSPMRYAWDYTHRYQKELNPVSHMLANFFLNSIRVWDYETRNRPHDLMANSRHVQKRIAKYWQRKSAILYPPIRTHRFKVHPQNENYFLILSSLTPFKRIDLAVEAFNQNGHHLVIIGSGKQRYALSKMANQNIEFLGHKSDGVVREYLEHCRGLIFPGEEDFGISPIEAMACGKPVLAYGQGGCLESIQTGVNGELFDEPTTASLNQGLERLMANETKYDRQKIRSIAEGFDESVFEKKIRAMIDQS